MLCDICEKSCEINYKFHSFYTAKIIKKEKVETLTYKREKTVYGDFEKHFMRTCRKCNIKNIIIILVTPFIAALWILTFFYAPLNDIRFIFPPNFVEKFDFNFWTFILGFIYLMFAIFGLLVIFSLGFTWRSRKLTQRALDNRKIEPNKQGKYQKLSVEAYESLNRNIY